MGLPSQLRQIPAPFNDFTGHWKNSDQAERVDPIEWQYSQTRIGKIRRTHRTDGIDDVSSANRLAANLGRNGKPVY